MKFQDMCAMSDELILRPLRREDYSAFVAGYAACGPARNRFDEGSFDTSFLTEDWYERLLSRREQEAAADYSYLFHLFRREDGLAVGYGDVTTLFREDFQFAKIGYTIHNPWWGRGYGSQCAKLLTQLGFETLNFHRLEAHVNLDNPASKAVLKKAGYRLEGVRKGFILEDGMWTDNEVYYQNHPGWQPNREEKEDEHKAL